MPRLWFPGTKGEIEESSHKHKYHSSLLMEEADTRLLIDYGDLHKYSIEELEPTAILITHAHPDHYAWLHANIETGVPVYLTQETLDYGKHRPRQPQVVEPGRPFTIGPFHCLAYRVIHSIRCPAVGYKISVSEKTIIYNPDLVDIVEKDEVLSGVDCYIGDGSAIKANLVRRRGDALFGHTRISTQVNWCRQRGISRIYFTHLGKETIEHEEEFVSTHGEITLAYDGMKLVL